MWQFFSQAAVSANFSYDIGELVEEGPIFSIHEGKSKKQGEVDKLVSIFLFDAKKLKDTGKAEYLTNKAKFCLRKMKTLVHPSLVKHLDSYESDMSVYIATEYVKPLRWYINNAHTAADSEEEEGGRQTKTQRDAEYLWGIHETIKALTFLNNDLSLIHGNVGTHSIYVDQAGEWKIGGFQLIDAPANIQLNNAPYAKYLPPEVTNNRGFFDSSHAPIWSVDIWSLGIVVWELYHSDNDDYRASSYNYKGNMKNFPNKKLSSIFLNLINANPTKRPSPDKLMRICTTNKNYAIFNDTFVQMCQFLNEFQLQDEVKKEHFFKNLKAEFLSNIPLKFQKYKILLILKNGVMFGGVKPAFVINIVFSITKSLTETEFKQNMQECVLKLFKEKDRITRMLLLKNLSCITDKLSKNIINETLFAQLATGFSDNVPAMREETIKASLLLADNLNEANMNGILLKHLSKLQVDSQPGIRVNATICLGKLAPTFTEQTRRRVLTIAFTKPLKDPFYHHKIAAMKAILATIDYYNPQTVSCQLLPAIAPLTMDVEDSVRRLAFQVIAKFVSILQTHSDNMPQSPSTMNNKNNVAGAGDVANNNKSNNNNYFALSTSSNNQNDSNTTNSGGSTWTDFMMNTITKASSDIMTASNGIVSKINSNSEVEVDKNDDNSNKPIPLPSLVKDTPRSNRLKLMTPSDGVNGGDDDEWGKDDVDELLDGPKKKPMQKKPNLGKSNNNRESPRSSWGNDDDGIDDDSDSGWGKSSKPKKGLGASATKSGFKGNKKPQSPRGWGNDDNDGYFDDSSECGAASSNPKPSRDAATSGFISNKTASRNEALKVKTNGQSISASVTNKGMKLNTKNKGWNNDGDGDNDWLKGNTVSLSKTSKTTKKTSFDNSDWDSAW